MPPSLATALSSIAPSLLELSPLKTLAVGDGANDVPMIQEAHVGVGVRGKEGTQAVNSADFAIPAFRMLAPLMLDQGRQANRKIGCFIVYFFYKNLLIIGGDLVWSFYSGLSGQILFPEWLSTCYNALWTSWPVLFSYGLDVDFSFKTLMSVPILYQTSRREFLNSFRFFIGILTGLYHGAVGFFLFFYGLKDGIFDESGVNYGHWAVSVACFSCLIIVGALKMALTTITWGKIQVFMSVFSVLFYFACLGLLQSYWLAHKFQWSVLNMMTLHIHSPKIILMVLVSPFVILLPDFVSSVYSTHFNPTLFKRMLYLTRTNTKLRSLVHVDVGESEDDLNLEVLRFNSQQQQHKTFNFPSSSHSALPQRAVDDSSPLAANSPGSTLAVHQRWNANSSSSSSSSTVMTVTIINEVNDEIPLRRPSPFADEVPFSFVHPSFWYLDLPPPFEIRMTTSSSEVQSRSSSNAISTGAMHHVKNYPGIRTNNDSRTTTAVTIHSPPSSPSHQLTVSSLHCLKEDEIGRYEKRRLKGRAFWCSGIGRARDLKWMADMESQNRAEVVHALQYESVKGCGKTQTSRLVCIKSVDLSQGKNNSSEKKKEQRGNHLEKTSNTESEVIDDTYIEEEGNPEENSSQHPEWEIRPHSDPMHIQSSASSFSQNRNTNEGDNAISNNNHSNSSDSQQVTPRTFGRQSPKNNSLNDSNHKQTNHNKSSSFNTTVKTFTSPLRSTSENYNGILFSPVENDTNVTTGMSIYPKSGEDTQHQAKSFT